MKLTKNQLRKVIKEEIQKLNDGVEIIGAARPLINAVESIRKEIENYDMMKLRPAEKAEGIINNIIKIIQTARGFKSEN